jgi:ssDNA-binding Zn-finger/Zn-ribbon topoisomerase 1
MTNDMRAPGNIYLCDKCDGYMIVKKAKDSNNFFMGCTNYKYDGKGCNHIDQIENKQKSNPFEVNEEEENNPFKK